MRSRGLRRRLVAGILAVGMAATVLPLRGSAHAAPPVVTVTTSGARIQVTSASLMEAIDALSRAAGFKVTYEGNRPNAMLFNAEVDTPSVAQTLFRLLDGQNLNYGVVFDRSGKKVTLLMVLGPAPKIGGGAVAAAASVARPQPTAVSRGPRRDLPAVDDDPAEAEPEPTPQPTPEPSPFATPRGGPGGQAQPMPPSPFAPRPVFPGPFGPRATPSPSP